MKRTLLIVSLLLFGLMLVGCGCQHEWNDATCTGSPRCRFCGERQGKALGHSFGEATCEAPKTCTLCSETEGEPLGHSWLDATCDNPKTCVTCAKTEGKPLAHQWGEATCAKSAACVLCGKTKGEPLAHTWVEATCTTPKHCTVCAAAEGEAQGHSWLDVTCTAPKTCSICALAEGEPLGHSWTKTSCAKAQSCLICGMQGTPALGHSWLEATCEESVRCAYCDVTQGGPLGHEWEAATPERPKTCTVCGKTEGLPIELDDRFVPADCEALFGSWRYMQTTTAEELNIPGFDEDLVEYITYTFGPYGDLDILTEVADVECYKAMLAADMAAGIYARLAAEEGMDAAAADAHWLETNHKTIAEYARELVERTTTDEDINILDKYVYYISDGTLCVSQHWEDAFTGYTFAIDGDQLTLTNELTGEMLVLTRVSRFFNI